MVLSSDFCHVYFIRLNSTTLPSILKGLVTIDGIGRLRNGNQRCRNHSPCQMTFKERGQAV